MSGRLEMEIGFGHKPRGTPRSRPGGEERRRLLILGDFSGRNGGEGGEPVTPLAERRPLPVDGDTFDEVFARFAPRLRVFGDAGARPVVVEFRGLGDFHPDRLFRQRELFGPLRDLGDRFSEPGAFESAMNELRPFVASFSSGAPSEGKIGSAARDSAERDEATLERLFGPRPLGAKANVEKPATAAQAFVGRLAALIEVDAGSSTPASESVNGVYRAALDELLGAKMRVVLHAPAFQRLEGTWRSLHLLIERLELDENLTLELLDVTQEELAEDFQRAGTRARECALHRVLAVSAERAGRWSLVACDSCFGSAAQDLSVLASLGMIGSLVEVPFLAAAGLELAGCPHRGDLDEPGRWAPPTEAWRALRRSPSAPWLGLALPRVLLRLPYGPRTDPIESFAFDETGPHLEHEAFLWGNPAFLVALLIAQGAWGRGGSLSLSHEGDVGDLPAYTYREDGEARLLPCAEQWVGERAAAALLERGFIPVMSPRDRNAVHVPWIPSLADPSRVLVTAGA